MANYATLKAAIQAVIYENGNQEITGEVMQATLLSMVNSLGANFQYAGIATPTTDPGTPDHNVAYIAGVGTYPNFNNTTVPINKIAVFKYNGSWTVETATIGQNYDNELDEIKTLGFLADVFQYSTFTAQTPNITLETPIRLSQVGDFIEIKVNANGTNGLFLRKATSYNPPIIRYTAQRTLQIRFTRSADGSFVYQDQRNVDWNAIQVIRIELTSITGSVYKYAIYLDGLEVGTNETGMAEYTQIGYNSIMTLYYIKFKSGGVQKKYARFASMTGAVGVTDVTVPTEIQSVTDIDVQLQELEQKVENLKGSNLLYLFKKDSTLWNVQSHFAVYVPLKAGYYMLIAIGYYTYSGAAGYPNGYWRMERANLMKYENGVWTVIQSQALVAGENEFVLQWAGGNDYNYSGGFSGGFHYGETINATGAWVEFIIDGQIISEPSKDLPLKPCSTFVYREYSPIYRRDTGTIAAWHLKETEITRDGYKCRNELFLVQSIGYFAYGGICCVSRYLGEKAMPENVNTITDLGDGSTTIANQFINNGNRIHYEGHGVITEVESHVLFGPNDSDCSRWVYNSPEYTKYYRRTPDIPGDVNNRLVTEQTVIFKMQ